MTRRGGSPTWNIWYLGYSGYASFGGGGTLPGAFCIGTMQGMQGMLVLGSMNTI